MIICISYRRQYTSYTHGQLLCKALFQCSLQEKQKHFQEKKLEVYKWQVLTLNVFSAWIGQVFSLIKQIYFCLLPREHWNYLKYVMKLQLKSCSERHFQHLAVSQQTAAQTHQLQFILLRLYSANKRNNTVTKNSIAFKWKKKSHLCFRIFNHFN